MVHLVAFDHHSLHSINFYNQFLDGIYVSERNVLESSA